MRAAKQITSVVAFFTALVLLGSSSYGQPRVWFDANAEELLNSADLVCRGRVLSTSPSEIEKDTSVHPPRVTSGRAARVKVMSIIKGSPTDHVDVVFRLSTNFGCYTELKKGQEGIFFLRNQGPDYRFVDDRNGILAIPFHEPIQYKSEDPVVRMLTELKLGVECETTLSRLQCIKQLGTFARPEAINCLRKLACENHTVVQGVSFAALIRLDCPPPAVELAKFFAREDDTQSGKNFGTTEYNNGSLKVAILADMGLRLNIICRDYRLNSSYPTYRIRKRVAREGSRKWGEFDLIKFLEMAPWQKRDTTLIQFNRVIADIIRTQIDERGVPAAINKTYRKGSLPILMELLGNENREIRFSAFVAIDRMIRWPRVFAFPGCGGVAEGSDENIDAHVRACRNWLDAHPRWVKEMNSDERKGKKTPQPVG